MIWDTLNAKHFVNLGNE